MTHCNRLRILCLFLLAAFCSALPALGQPARPTIRLEVDATDAPRKIFHARLNLSVSPGPLTLVFPKWIQGEHGPTGPITDAVGLQITASGQRVPWKRDPFDMHAYKLEVPSGATEIEVALDFLSPTGASGFTSAASATSQLFVLNWNQLLLYPKERAANATIVAASLQVPEGWKSATALPIVQESGNRKIFAPVNLTTLVDSPVLAGVHFRTLELAAEPKHYLHLAADSAAALAIKPEVKTQLSQLIAELRALFGAHPYREYHFLLALSDHVAHFGMEHHQSSENRFAERTLLDTDLHNRFMWILAHEIVHAWNGKYRRPDGLVRPDFQQPLNSELLWVYEGLTHYLGFITAARSGLWSPEIFRENWAFMAARQGLRTGREWRPLVDTCVAAQLLYPAAESGRSWRRDVDFYEEGALVWLEADVLIRQRSQGRMSLDDFCRKFHGGQSGSPAVKPYTFDEVVQALNAVVPHDWREFFEARVNRVKPSPPLEGIALGGWKLAFEDSPSNILKAYDSANKEIDLTWSIGLLLDEEGAIKDVVPRSAADHGGVAPGMKLIAVNGRRWSATLLREAIHASPSVDSPLDLLMENTEFFTTCRLNYREGLRYPVLERDPAKEDLLEKLLKPLSTR